MNLIIWIALVVGPVVAALLTVGGLGQFIDLPSVFILIIPTIGTLLVGFNGYFISSITSVWKKDVDNLNLVKGVEFWKATKRYAIAYGFIGTVMGMVLILQVFGGDPGGQFLPLSIAILTVYYGLILGYLVFDPIACLLGLQFLLKKVNFRF
jgi:flagellar motor component MotA